MNCESHLSSQTAECRLPLYKYASVFASCGLWWLLHDMKGRLCNEDRIYQSKGPPTTVATPSQTTHSLLFYLSFVILSLSIILDFLPVPKSTQAGNSRHFPFHSLIGLHRYKTTETGHSAFNRLFLSQQRNDVQLARHSSQHKACNFWMQRNQNLTTNFTLGHGVYIYSFKKQKKNQTNSKTNARQGGHCSWQMLLSIIVIII